MTELRTTATHIYEWLDEHVPTDDGEKYAMQWFERYCAGRPEGMSVREMIAFDEERINWLATNHLYCDYEGKRYRVPGASRLGDVWLNVDFNDAHGHDLRIDVTGCSNWSSSP